jgi:hypothetical protein
MINQKITAPEDLLNGLVEYLLVVLGERSKNPREYQNPPYTGYPYPPESPCYGYTKEQCQRICADAKTEDECRDAIAAFEAATSVESDDGSSFWDHCRLENGHIVCSWPVLDIPPRPLPDPSPIASQPAVLLHNGWLYIKAAKLQNASARPAKQQQVSRPSSACSGHAGTNAASVLRRNTPVEGGCK